MNLAKLTNKEIYWIAANQREYDKLNEQIDLIYKSPDIMGSHLLVIPLEECAETIYHETLKTVKKAK